MEKGRVDRTRLVCHADISSVRVYTVQTQRQLPCIKGMSTTAPQFHFADTSPLALSPIPLRPQNYVHFLESSGVHA